MKDLEQVEQEKLEKAIMDLNEFTNNLTVEDVSLKEAITVIGKEKQVLVDEFTKKVESLPEDVKGDLPDPICDFYNDLYADEAVKTQEPKEETRLEKSKRKAEEAKKQKKEAKKEKTKVKREKKVAKAKEKNKEHPNKGRVIKPKDEFGFTIGGRNAMFLKSIMEKPMNMAEVKALPWNSGRGTFYDAFNKLKKMGVTYMDDSGKMCVHKEKIPAPKVD